MAQETTPQKIARLESRREMVDFNLQNASWGAGARYRDQLAKIDAELHELRKAA